MLKHLVCATVLLGVMVGSSIADATMVVIKVKGVYAIVNKGTNQGVQKGQLFYIKRESVAGLADIGKVRVIRVTANRAAVEQVEAGETAILKKGDMLYTENEQAIQSVRRRVKPEPASRPASAPKRIERRKSNIEPISEPSHKMEEIIPPSPTNRVRRNPVDLIKPWISINVGAIVPNKTFGNDYQPSFKFGGSYLVPAGDFNIGLEINNTIVNESATNGLVGFNNTSSSLLEVHLLLQRFFAQYFFMEFGGGIYRPKLTTLSIDNVEASFSKTNFGFFGGAGFYIPTSPYAGISLKGRLHNFFDPAAKQYYGITGGFRFKIK